MNYFWRRRSDCTVRQAVFRMLPRVFRVARLVGSGTIAGAFVFLMAATFVSCKKAGDADQFTRLTNLGKSQLEGGDAGKAIDLFRQALVLNPTLPEAQLNLANAYLLANQPENAIQQSAQVLRVDPNSAAAHYLIGCANLRLGEAEEALKALQQSFKIDPAVTALNFQLALAHERLGHQDEAIQQLQTVVDFEPEHPAAHYRLSQILLRAGRPAEAAEELKKHQELIAKRPNISNDVAVFERCKHTQARLPFKLEQPLPEGVKVAFVDATSSALPNASAYGGPLGLIDIAHTGRNSLFVREGAGFRLLLNSNATFVAQETSWPGHPGATYRQALVGDLQNDQTEDVLMLGDKGCHVFKFTTNGVVTDATRAAGFGDFAAIDGVLLDFDYTGKLGLIALQPDGKGVRAFRNLSSTFAMYFSGNSVTSGLPASLPGARQLLIEDWNNDEMMDVMLTREGQPPLVFPRERGGPFISTNLGASFPAGVFTATGDLNNDSFPDVVSAVPNSIEIVFGGGGGRTNFPLNTFPVTSLSLVDYDNDGWLDVCAAGESLRVWRNRGIAGFRETTKALGLEKLAGGRISVRGGGGF
jgi:Flp pilus assembly protein TadD